MRSPLVRVEVSKQPGQGGADGIGAPAEQLGNQTHVVIARNAEIPGDGAGQGLVGAIGDQVAGLQADELGRAF